MWFYRLACFFIGNKWIFHFVCFYKQEKWPRWSWVALSYRRVDCVQTLNSFYRQYRKLCQILNFKIAGWLCWWPVHFDVSCTSSFTHLHLADKPQHIPEQRFPKAFLSSWPFNSPSITFHINELMKSFLAIKKEKEKANKITPRNEFSYRKQEMIIFTRVIPKL